MAFPLGKDVPEAGIWAKVVETQNLAIKVQVNL